jgi:hypothetical protein
MERCGIREALGDDEVIRRADEIAAAAARYAEASGAANAAVLDEHFGAEPLQDLIAALHTKLLVAELERHRAARS